MIKILNANAKNPHDYKSVQDRAEWIDNENGNFVKVYFRINTIGFDCAAGFFTKESDRDTFHNEASEIVKSFGIVEDCGYKQNNEYLYVHPQNISGIIAKSKVKTIAEALDDSSSMFVRWVDVYDEYVYMEDTNYIEILNGKRLEIAQAIIERTFTKRTNRFYTLRDVAVEMQERFKVNRINAIENINTPKTTYRFVVEVIKQLVENGYLVQAEDYYYIRSLNKGEQRKNKIDYTNMEVKPIYSV